MDQVSQFAEWLARNPWLILSGFLITVLSFVSALLLYLRSKRIKAPCYAIRSTNLVKDMVSRIESLEMTYGGQRIENLTVTKVAFWNAGKDTILETDVASADRLALHCKDSKRILDARTLHVSNVANQFSLSPGPDGKSVFLRFEFLERNEGAVIQVLHTGNSNADIELLGTIKGAGKLRRIRVPMLRRLLPFAGSRFFKDVSHRELTFIFAAATFLAPIFLAAIFFFGGRRALPAKDAFTEIGAIALAAVPYWIMGYQALKRSLPSGFIAFEEDS